MSPRGKIFIASNRWRRQEGDYTRIGIRGVCNFDSGTISYHNRCHLDFFTEEHLGRIMYAPTIPLLEAPNTQEQTQIQRNISPQVSTSKDLENGQLTTYQHEGPSLGRASYNSSAKSGAKSSDDDGEATARGSKRSGSDHVRKIPSDTGVEKYLAFRAEEPRPKVFPRNNKMSVHNLISNTTPVEITHDPTPLSQMRRAKRPSPVHHDDMMFGGKLQQHSSTISQLRTLDSRRSFQGSFSERRSPSCGNKIESANAMSGLLSEDKKQTSIHSPTPEFTTTYADTYVLDHQMVGAHVSKSSTFVVQNGIMSGRPLHEGSMENRTNKLPTRTDSSSKSSSLARDVKSRYQPLTNEPKAKRPWSEQEDCLLRRLVDELGQGLWAAIAAQIPGRTGKQVRERWLNHLSPNVTKRPWSMEEDEIIIDSHKRFGSCWSRIAKLLEGRSDNSVKNRFYTTLRRRIAAPQTLSKRGNPNLAPNAVPSKRKKEGSPPSLQQQPSGHMDHVTKRYKPARLGVENQYRD